MHIPDGYLGPYTYGGLWAAMVPVWIYASKKVREALKVSQVPLLALCASFSFVIMMFNVPIPAGTTGHATGSTLIAILIGPWAAVIAVSIALVIQALIFGDGGITAIGANCFNIAFAEVLVGYGIYMLVRSRSERPSAETRIGKSVTPGDPPGREVRSEKNDQLQKRDVIGAGIGAYAGINVAALLTAFELGIQTILHIGSDGRPLYSPFPLKVTVPVIMLQHISIFGFVEALVTVLVLTYISKSHPELIRG